jgi:hypothetical protein
VATVLPSEPIVSETSGADLLEINLTLFITCIYPAISDCLHHNSKGHTGCGQPVAGDKLHSRRLPEFDCRFNSLGDSQSLARVKVLCFCLGEKRSDKTSHDRDSRLIQRETYMHTCPNLYYDYKITCNRSLSIATTGAQPLPEFACRRVLERRLNTRKTSFSILRYTQASGRANNPKISDASINPILFAILLCC